MAVPALCHPILCGELPRMWIGMARLAVLWRSLELNLMRSGKSLMTLPTCHCPVSSFQRKFRFRMVKTPHVDPRPGIVASLTPQRGPIGTAQRHAFFELPFVGIGVTGCASSIVEMERQNLVRSASQTGLVTLGTRDGDVGAGERIA